MPSPYHAIKENRGVDEQVKLPCLALPQAGGDMFCVGKRHNPLQASGM